MQTQTRITGPSGIEPLAITDDFLAGYEFHRGRRSEEKTWPERLMFAILLTGLFEQDWEWISNLDERFLFSFTNVCEILGYNAAALRERLWASRTSGLRLLLAHRNIHDLIGQGRLRVAQKRYRRTYRKTGKPPTQRRRH